MARRDTARLLGLFAAWKLLLLAVVLAGPGYDAAAGRDGGYDTSTRLHLVRGGPGPAPLLRSTPLAAAAPLATAAGWLVREAGERLVLRLTRWDAVYFTQVAAHGSAREQEWAFGWGFAAALRRLGGVFCARFIRLASPPDTCAVR